MNTVVFYQMRHRFVIGYVIDSNNFNRWMVEQQPEKISSDTSKTVDGDACFQIRNC
jgi:hypothetical protein